MYLVKYSAQSNDSFIILKITSGKSRTEVEFACFSMVSVGKFKYDIEHGLFLSEKRRLRISLCKASID